AIGVVGVLDAMPDDAQAREQAVELADMRAQFRVKALDRADNAMMAGGQFLADGNAGIIELEGLDTEEITRRLDLMQPLNERVELLRYGRQLNVAINIGGPQQDGDEALDKPVIRRVLHDLANGVGLDAAKHRHRQVVDQE